MSNRFIKNNCLPAGTELDHYSILSPISAGGFSIVYLAVDQQTDNKVVIKEYYPKHQVKRLRNHTVVPISEKKERSLQKGRMLFFQEASTLATLKHPNVVNVVNFFRDNGTVYMVMEFEKGKNMQSYITQRNGNLSERFILTTIPALLEGLKAIHEAGYLHLDIKPANIHIRPGGRPLLLDFGSVHRRELSRQHQPGQVVTAGYAPTEQFAKTGYIGPWTDLYALGASMRSCIDGTSPLDSRKRDKNDKMIPASECFAKNYSPKLLSAIDWCMELDPELRPQSVAELLEKLPPIPEAPSRTPMWLARLTGVNIRRRK